MVFNMIPHGSIVKRLTSIVLIALFVMAPLNIPGPAAGAHTIDTFSSGAKEARLVFDGKGNLTVNITLPKNATVMDARLTVAGEAKVTTMERAYTTDGDFGSMPEKVNVTIASGSVSLVNESIWWNKTTDQDFQTGNGTNVDIANGAVTIKAGPPTSMMVNDDVVTADQSSPYIASDVNGTVHAIWADDRQANLNFIYYSNWNATTDKFSNNKLVYFSFTGSLSPRVAPDSKGVLHAIWLEAGGSSGGTSTSVHYAKSSDNGTSWSAAKLLMLGQDPDIYVDSKDILHVVAYASVWNPVGGTYTNRIYIINSTDGGSIWDSPRVVADGSSASVGTEPKVAVNSTGCEFVAWSDQDNVFVSRSSGGGAFGAPVQVNDQGLGHSSGNVDIDIAPTGKIHVVWDDNRNGNSDIYYANSLDGSTFSADKKVNGDAGTQFQGVPSISVSRSGTVLIAWQDERSVACFDIYAATSIDGGSTFTANARIDDDTDSRNQFEPIVSLGPADEQYYVWTDMRNGNNDPDVYFTAGGRAEYTTEARDCGPIDLKVREVDWDAATPKGTAVIVSLRSSPDGIVWTGWEPLGSRDKDVTTAGQRYIQWKARLLGTPSTAPSLQDVSVLYRIAAPTGHIGTQAFAARNIFQAKAAWTVMANEGTFKVGYSADHGPLTYLMNDVWQGLPSNASAVSFEADISTQGLSPVLDDLTVSYRGRLFPENASMVVSGAKVWSQAGECKNSTDVVITAALNGALAALAPGKDGNVTVPVVLASDAAGVLVLGSLSISYDVRPGVPHLLTPNDGALIGIETPPFTLYGSDEEGDKVSFSVEVRSAGSPTPLVTFSPKDSAWDKAGYGQGEVATLTLPGSTSLQNGKYQWKARTWDGTLWSDWSLPSNFTVDRTPPTGKVITRNISSDMANLDAELNFSDPETGIVKLEYAVGSRSGAADIHPWETANQSIIRITGLNMSVGSTYYISGRAYNGAGLYFGATAAVNAVGPVATISYPEGVVTNATIPLKIGGSDPAGAPIVEGRLMYLSVPSTEKFPINPSPTQMIVVPGNSLNATSFKGEPGRAYKFYLQVKNSHGTWGYINGTGKIVRVDAGPVPVISGKNKVKVGERVSFSALASSDQDNDTLNYTWTLPNGKTETGANLIYKFSKAGTYKVTLTVSDGYISKSTSTDVIVKSSGNALGNLMIALLAIVIVVIVVIAVVYLLWRGKKGRKKGSSDEAES